MFVGLNVSLLNDPRLADFVLFRLLLLLLDHRRDRDCQNEDEEDHDALRRLGDPEEKAHDKCESEQMSPSVVIAFGHVFCDRGA